MRPEKAFLIIYLGDQLTEAHSKYIEKGISGRLVLRSPLITSALALTQNSAFWSDENLPNTQHLVSISDLLSSASKLNYVFLHSPAHLDSLLAVSEERKFFTSLIFNTLSPLPEARSRLTPKQSYMFENCEEIQSPFIGSVFYTDFEAGYTRQDWLKTTEDLNETGGNCLILFEKHHTEVQSRLGLNPKYGS